MWCRPERAGQREPMTRPPGRQGVIPREDPAVTRVIGHRGAPRVARENTVEAFEAARALGADMVELDVRRTLDGRFAVHHDARLPDGRLLVETPAAELPAWVPSLDEALRACDTMAVNIEVKNLPVDPDHDETDAVAAGVADLVAERGLHEQVLVSSFNLRSIDRVRAEDAAVATALLVVAVQPDVPRLLERLLRHGHRVLHPHDSAVTDELVEACAAAGVALNVWTVNDADRIRQLAALGVAGVVTDVPDVAAGVLRG